MKKILIIGAASAIATETAKSFAKDGAKLFLVDINSERLNSVAKHIKVWAPNSEILNSPLDVNSFDKHCEVFENAVSALNGLDAILIAHGTLPDQKKTQEDVNLIIKEFNTNGLSVISLASIAANYFEKQKKGCIAAISSVAGDRGRQSNYIYGAAKGSIAIYFQGLRNRLFPSGVTVLTIKPGFVDTPMTAHLTKNPLFASAESVGRGIYDSMISGKDIAYIPSYWRIILTVVKLIPEKIFKRLKL